MEVEYLISNGHNTYIRQDPVTHKYVEVRNQVLADSWDNRAIATKILENSLSKSLKRRFKVVERKKPEVKKIIEKKEEVPKTTVPKVKRPEDCMGDVIKLAEGLIDDFPIEELEERLSLLTSIAKETEERREKLCEALSSIDKLLSDIRHYREFGNFNAYQCWIVDSTEKQVLLKRRKIKNEYLILDQLYECKVNYATLQSVQQALIDLQENRKYKPRIMPELFSEVDG